MTEQEARTKWCPQARNIAITMLNEKPIMQVSGNRMCASPLTAQDMNPASCRCIASDCMAWRWTGVAHGYCGLAGSQSSLAAVARGEA